METINQLLLEIKNGLHLPKLADDLHVLSCLLHKQNNSHRKYKFYQSLKQVQTYMKKFVELGLKHSVSYKNSALHLKNSKNFIDFANRLFKGYILLYHVQIYCKNTVRFCLQQLTLCHFVSLHFAIISMVSSICIKVENLQKDVCSWYTRVHEIAIIRKLKTPKLSQVRITSTISVPEIRKLSKREKDLLKQLNEDDSVRVNEENKPLDVNESAKESEPVTDDAESFLSKMKRLLESSNSPDRKRVLEKDEATAKKKRKKF